MKNVITVPVAALSAALALAISSTSVAAANPATKADDTWISVSGTVKSVMPDTFMLDYGKGTIKVEMDDWDAEPEAYKVVPGDKVTVNGIVDDDLFEERTIEAGSVYVEGLNTYFYASAADEEDTFITIATPIIDSSVLVQGEVTGKNGREFTVDSGARMIRVDTDTMAYNPLDNEGFQRIEEGDRVSVVGTLETDIFEGRELKASSVVTLAKGS